MSERRSGHLAIAGEFGWENLILERSKARKSQRGGRFFQKDALAGCASVS
jgi:hypothetical protein